MNSNAEREGQGCKLEKCLFFCATKLIRELGKIADEAFSKTGLSPSHALLLYMVNHRGGMPQKEIGEFLHLTPSTVTRLIEKLERKGLIAKSVEGKSVYLCTTKQGLALQNEIVKSWDQLNGTFEDILTEEEMTRFIEISDKLLEALNR